LALKQASTENPEAAIAEHRQKDAEQHRIARARNGADVRARPIEHILHLVRGGRSKH
jgi:hypothetical protein